MTADDLRIHHSPFGLEHPYDQEPSERSPRDPQAGQPVVLGVVVQPVAGAKTVWATWKVDGVDGEVETRGQKVGEDADGAIWAVNLPAFDGGQRVTYRLHARGDKLQVSSDPFTFFVSSWHDIGEVIRRRFTVDGLALECGAEHPNLQFTLRLAFPEPHLLHTKLSCQPDTARAEFGQRVEGIPEGAVYRLLEDGPMSIKIATEALQVAVHLRPCKLEVRRADGTLILQEATPARWLMGDGNQPRAVRQEFQSPADEGFYGFGERFNALNQRGNELDIRVFEEYKKQGKRTYLPVPFLLSSRGYGLHIQTSCMVAFDLAAALPDRWSYTAEVTSDAVLEYDFIAAPNPTLILSSFVHRSAPAALPPMWAFGPWMSSNEWSSQARVMREYAKTTELGIPATVLVIEAWSDESTFYIWNDARYRRRSPAEAFTLKDFEFPPDGRWPDPKSMIDELHRQGTRVLLWQIPVMKKLESPHPQHDADEAYMLAHSYHVQEEDGSPYRVRPFWFRGGLVLDFTNPAASEWWLGKRAYLIDELGIDGFKTDGGEHLWGSNLRFADGRSGKEVWNLYPNLYVGAYHRFAAERRAEDALTFSRAGFAGAQAYPCHWAGDEDSTWEAFRASVLAGLNTGISGIPFWGWDLAGFSGEIPSSELYLRAAAMAAFCPIMQYHSEYNEHPESSRDRTPWNIQARTGDTDVVPIFRKFANLRMNLLPYIYNEARKSSRSGVPLMRALWLEFPEDSACQDHPYQYFFGDQLLVAPVVEEGRTSWPVYLPEGEWRNLWSGESHAGPTVVEVQTPKDVIPVFVRAGAILPVNLGGAYELGDPVGNAVDRYRNLCLMLHPSTKSDYEWFDPVTSLDHALGCATGPTENQLEVVLNGLQAVDSLLIWHPRPTALMLEDHLLEESHDSRIGRLADRPSWMYDVARTLVLIRPALHQGQDSIRITFLKD